MGAGGGNLAERAATVGRRTGRASAMIVAAMLWVPGVIVALAAIVFFVYFEVELAPPDTPLFERIRAVACIAAMAALWIVPGVVAYRRFVPDRRLVVIGAGIGVAIGLVALVVLALYWAAIGVLLLAVVALGHGRPVRVAGAVASPSWPRRVRRGAPRSPPVDVALDHAPGALGRIALAVAWARDGAEEHASVRAFEELGARLAALDAPNELVRRCAKAADDERRHAALSFAVARAYIPWLDLEGRPQPSWHAASAEPRASALAALACESLEDGCYAEGYASATLAAGAASCEEPAVRAVLEELSRDEHTHAELAWATLAFCTREGGVPVRARLEASMGRLRSRRLAAGFPTAALGARHGRFTEAGRGVLAACVRKEVERRLATVLSD